MNSADTTQIIIQILTSLVTVISILTVLIKIGAWKGKQDQLNITQAEKNNKFECGIEKNAEEIKEVKDHLIDKISGTEQRLITRIDNVKDELSREIRNAKA